MKPKQILILAVILIILAGLVILKNLKPSPVVGRSKDVRLETQFDSKAASEIKIGKADAEIVLSKADGVWRCPGKWNAQADQGKVAQLLEVLTGLRGEFRSDHKDLLADYEIDDQNALQISVSGKDKSLLDLFIGLSRPDQRGIFLRLKGSNAVYFSNDQLLVNIGLYGNIKTEAPKLDFWIDLRLLDLHTEQVSSFSIVQLKNGKEDSVFGFERSAASNDATAHSWKPIGLPEDFKVDESKVDAYLRKFQFERAKEVLDPSTPYGFDHADFKLTINQNGAEKILLFKRWDEKTGDCVVLVVGEPEVKLVGSANASGFKADPSFFATAETKIE